MWKKKGESYSEKQLWELMNRNADFQTVLHPTDIAVPGQGGNFSPSVDFPDTVIIPVGKIKVPLGIENHSKRAFYLCGNSR